MNQADNYASDSDHSDDDYDPSAEAAALDSDAISEAKSDDDDDVSDAADNNETDTTGRKNVKKGKPIKGTSKSKLKVPDCGVEEEAISRRSTRHGNSNGKAIREKDELESDEEDKSRRDTLWANFLSDVNPNTTNSGANKAERTAADKSANTDDVSHNGVAEPKVAHIAGKVDPPKITVTEIVDFAGEEVQLKTVVNADSIKLNKLKPAGTVPDYKKHAASLIGLKRSAATSSAGGLGGVLNKIGKKKKISVLEKSQLDWKSFKQDEGIEEELQTHNKGKDGFLERQDFLQRTDLRQFEIEKSLRHSRRSN